MNEIINAVQPAVASAATLILTAVISAVGAKLVALINRRKEKVVAEIGTAEYNRKLGIAKQVWGQWTNTSASHRMCRKPLTQPAESLRK